ncbi:MAG: hypothetical protein PVH62_10350 [Anaerolineae bacterium]|jgi:hypothetical protein
MRFTVHRDGDWTRAGDPLTVLKKQLEVVRGLHEPADVLAVHPTEVERVALAAVELGWNVEVVGRGGVLIPEIWIGRESERREGNKSQASLPPDAGITSTGKRERPRSF